MTIQVINPATEDALNAYEEMTSSEVKSIIETRERCRMKLQWND